MPEEQPIPGVLVSGIPGNKSESLTEGEYWTLKTCLDFSRGEDKELSAVAEAISCCSGQYTKPQYDIGWLLSQFCHHLGECTDDVQGLLFIAAGRSGPTLLREPRTWNCEFDEGKALADLLTVLRTGGWFARWLRLQISLAAKGGAPSPITVMESLSSEALKFQQRIEDAKEVLENHWVELGFTSAAPPDPAAYKAPEPGAAKHVRKNRGKKAA